MPSRSIDNTTARDLFAADFVPSNTRQRLIATATNLFYVFGVHAVGLDRILTEVGVTKTTFYNHFESKDDLVLEGIRFRDEWESAAWSRMVQQLAPDDPKAQLLAMCDVLHTWFTDPRFRGCIFINTAAEFPSLHDPIHQAVLDHMKRTHDGICQLARAAGLRDCEQFAGQFGLLLQGAIVCRQATGDNSAAATAKHIAQMLIQQYSPA